MSRASALQLQKGPACLLVTERPRMGVPKGNLNGALARCYSGFSVPANQQIKLVRGAVEVHAGGYAMYVQRIAEDRTNDSGD